MEIRNTSRSTIEEFLEARKWHWKKHGSLQYLWFVAGVLLLLFGGLGVATEDRVFPIYLLIVGVYCISRKKILEYRFRRSMKTSPAIDKEVVWKLSMDGFTQESELGKSDLSWDSVYQSYSTKNGYLVYPQKNMYYWIPRSGFDSEDDFEEVDKILKEKTENKEIV